MNFWYMMVRQSLHNISKRPYKGCSISQWCVLMTIIKIKKRLFFFEGYQNIQLIDYCLLYIQWQHFYACSDDSEPLKRTIKERQSYNDTFNRTFQFTTYLNGVDLERIVTEEWANWEISLLLVRLRTSPYSWSIHIIPNNFISNNSYYIVL